MTWRSKSEHGVRLTPRTTRLFRGGRHLLEALARVAPGIDEAKPSLRFDWQRHMTTARAEAVWRFPPAPLRVTRAADGPSVCPLGEAANTRCVSSRRIAIRRRSPNPRQPSRRHQASALHAAPSFAVSHTDALPALTAFRPSYTGREPGSRGHCSAISTGTRSVPRLRLRNAFPMTEPKARTASSALIA